MKLQSLVALSGGGRKCRAELGLVNGRVVSAVGLPLVLPEEVALGEGRIGRGEEGRGPVLFEFGHEGFQGSQGEHSDGCVAFEVGPEPVNGKTVPAFVVEYPFHWLRRVGSQFLPRASCCSQYPGGQVSASFP